jgi:hypothetical protein
MWRHYLATAARTADTVRLMLWRISVPVLVAWATVSSNTLRLARASPVHALR